MPTSGLTDFHSDVPSFNGTHTQPRNSRRDLGFQFLDVPTHVVLHGLGETDGIYVEQRRGCGSSDQGERQLRIPDGIHLHRIRNRENLRPHSSRRSLRLERIRHSHATK